MCGGSLTLPGSSGGPLVPGHVQLPEARPALPGALLLRRHRAGGLHHRPGPRLPPDVPVSGAASYLLILLLTGELVATGSGQAAVLTN